ncbi:hypothetical protein chiPu_0029629, partial [Chiloscyllium punctatum]|nr:hypothetical protein [Chiloscyllium punctatum]
DGGGCCGGVVQHPQWESREFSCDCSVLSCTSIRSSWNIGVIRFLVEKLKIQLAVSSHHYTDKELKGACVAYFLTKRREYRNAMNPYKSLKEREDKKLRSRRYRVSVTKGQGLDRGTAKD